MIKAKGQLHRGIMADLMTLRMNLIVVLRANEVHVRNTPILEKSNFLSNDQSYNNYYFCT